MGRRCGALENALPPAATSSWRMESMRISTIQTAPPGWIFFWARWPMYLAAPRIIVRRLPQAAAPIAESKLGNQFRELLEGPIDSRVSCQILSVKLPLDVHFV